MGDIFRGIPTTDIIFDEKITICRREAAKKRSQKKTFFPASLRKIVGVFHKLHYFRIEDSSLPFLGDLFHGLLPPKVVNLSSLVPTRLVSSSRAGGGLCRLYLGYYLIVRKCQFVIVFKKMFFKMINPVTPPPRTPSTGREQAGQDVARYLLRI